MFPVFGGFAVSTLLLGLLTCWLSTPQKRKRRTPEDLPFHLSHPSHEQRGAVRCGRHSVRVLIRTGEEEKPQEGWVIDRSTGGFGFLLIAAPVAWSAGPFGDKSVLEVRPTNAPFDGSWVRVEIRHIDQKSNYWLAGGRLLDDIPPEVWPFFGYETLQAVQGREHGLSSSVTGRGGYVDALERSSWVGHGSSHNSRRSNVYQRSRQMVLVPNGRHTCEAFADCDDIGGKM